MNGKIKGFLPNGEEKEFDVIATFKNEDNGKDYIVYTDNSIDEENKLRIFVSTYDTNTYKCTGTPETKEEWHMVYKLLSKILLQN